MVDQHAPLVMEEVTDPEELANARAQDALFERNSAWLQAHAAEIYRHYRGKCIVVAGEELFVSDTPAEALAQARAAHPEAGGSVLIRYILREKVARVYLPRLCNDDGADHGPPWAGQGDRCIRGRWASSSL